MKKLHIFVELYNTLKWSISELNEYRKKLIAYVCILVFQTLFGLYIAGKVGSIVDLAVSDNVSTLLVNGAVFVILYTANALISILGNRFAAKNYNGMYNSLELKVYKKIMDASWEELTNYHSGDLITRLNSDIKTVAGNTSGLVPTFVSKLLLIIVSGCMVIYMDYTMVVVAVVVAPLVFFSTRIFLAKIYEYQMKIKEVESEITSYNKETFNNIQAVKAFGLGNKFYDKMLNLEQNRLRVDLLSNKYSLLSWLTTQMLSIVAGTICIGWAVFRVHAGVITIGSLAIMLYLAVQMGYAAKALLDMIPTMMEFVASSDRVRVLMNLSDEKFTEDDDSLYDFANLAAESGVEVAIEDMSFSYKNGYQVFDNVSLEAKPGQIVALVGPSGEGKTTMLRIILGIVTAQAGRVVAINGNNEVQFGKQTRGLISYVPQGNTMMAGTILENMRMVNEEATEEEVIEALETACIYDFVKNLPDGINHRLGENGLGFSEGQNQRLCIARALLKKTPIILMDEATSALDVATERKVLNNIMKKDPHRTCILTTHRPSVLSLCDRVYHINKKKVAVLGENEIQKLIDEF